MYVKVLHSPIIIFYLNFFSKELLNLYFTTAIKRDSVKTSLKHILQPYLQCPRKFCAGITKYFEAPNVSGFILVQNPSTNPLRIRIPILSIHILYLFVLSEYQEYKGQNWTKNELGFLLYEPKQQHICGFLQFFLTEMYIAKT